MSRWIQPGPLHHRHRLQQKPWAATAGCQVGIKLQIYMEFTWDLHSPLKKMREEMLFSFEEKSSI